MLTMGQGIGICLLLFGSFLFGYMRGRAAERQRFREFVLKDILKEIQDISDAKKPFDKLDQTEKNRN